MKSLIWLAGLLADFLGPAGAPDQALQVDVTGDCIDRQVLLEALLAERVTRKEAALAVHLVCQKRSIEVILETPTAGTSFAHKRGLRGYQALERELALVIAEHELHLANRPDDDGTLGEEEPTETPRDEDNALDQSQAEAAPAVLTPSDDFAFEDEDFTWPDEAPRKPPVRQGRLVGGPLLRGHASGAVLVGGAIHAELNHFMAGAEFVLADDDGRTAQDVGVVLGYILFDPLDEFVSPNAGIKARGGYSNYNGVEAPYLGGSVFATFDFVFKETVLARLLAELGRGGFSDSTRLTQIQTWYLGCGLMLGIAKDFSKKKH